MPVGVVKTEKDEDRWESCKISVRKAHPDMEDSDRKRFFKLVMGCFMRRKSGIGGKKGRWSKLSKKA